MRVVNRRYVSITVNLEYLYVIVAREDRRRPEINERY